MPGPLNELYNKDGSKPGGIPGIGGRFPGGKLGKPLAIEVGVPLDGKTVAGENVECGRGKSPGCLKPKGVLLGSVKFGGRCGC